MWKDKALMAVLLGGSFTSAYLYPSAVTYVFASLMAFFYGVQIFDKITIALNQLNSRAFPAIHLCYVCGAVAGTWAVTGLWIGLLPTLVIVFMSGLSAFALSDEITRLVEGRWVAVVAQVLSLLAFNAVALFLVHRYSGAVLFHAFLYFWGGVLSLAFAELADHQAKYLSSRFKNWTYYNVEKNIVMFVLIMAGTATVVV